MQIKMCLADRNHGSLLFASAKKKKEKRPEFRANAHCENGNLVKLVCVGIYIGHN